MVFTIEGASVKAFLFALFVVVDLNVLLRWILLITVHASLLATSKIGDDGS